MSSLAINFDKYKESLERTRLTKDIGKVTEVTGHLMAGFLPGAFVGSVCEVFPSSRTPSFLAEVVGFRDQQVLLMPLGDMRGVGLGSKIILQKPAATLRIGEGLLNRVIDGMGNPMDNGAPIEAMGERSIYSLVENPLRRSSIQTAADFGIRAINGLITIGLGQRISIMAGSGVGKSVLLGMIARNASFDINVIALVGERGREVKEFIDEILGPEGLKRSVIVVATSDQSPLLRMRAAFVATSVAEFFCAKGAQVLLMMDSVTRFAMAQREIGLSVGEPPASKGYTPSVFAWLPKLLERAGSYTNKGSITGIYTVLVEGDDMNDPIADSVRSIVDGHIVLSRTLAQKGHYPAIDVLQSTSRVMRQIVSDEQMQMGQSIRENMAIYQEAEDLINIGAYKSGSNPRIDQAISMNEPIRQFLRQRWDESTSLAQTLNQMHTIVGGLL